jgi:hypothetical protein
MTTRRSLALAAAVGLAAVAAPGVARAFCGFYVSGGDTKLTNNATMVVLMREGQRTVLSMQNNYKGPPADFAMVVPVPIVLQKENVKTLPREVFDRVDLMASPRLVEYWEQDPCPPERMSEPVPTAAPAPMAAKAARAEAGAADLGVRVEAEFTVGEYEVVVLSARDSDGLDTWLHQNNYKIPDGAEPVLRPYVAKGMKFFVAKVNANKVKFENGQAVLSPLRFHYDADDFSLPVRLGLLNSDGKQELVVHILARGKRYEVANYANVTIPTNYDVAESARDQFGAFYAALFDRTMEKHPGAIVTEYAWDAQTCDPCPGPTLQSNDILTLGADALSTAQPPANLPTDPGLKPVVTISEINGGAARNATGIVNAMKPRLEACYRAELERTASPKGQVSIAASLAQWGRPKEVKTNVTGSLPAPLLACVERTARFTSFGEAPPGTTVTYKVGFDLQRGGPGEGWWKPPPVSTWGFTLTRLHTRYNKDALGQDLIFREASPIVGGREEYGAAEQDHGAKPGPTNNFQARYAIRHPWTGPITCANPKRGVWGGPPPGVNASNTPKAAQKIAYVPRGQVQLASLLKQDVPDLGLTAPPQPSARARSCACSTPGSGGPLLPCTLAVFGALLLNERRRSRRK